MQRNRTEAAIQKTEAKHKQQDRRRNATPVRGKEHCRQTDRKRDAVSVVGRKRARPGFSVEKEPRLGSSSKKRRRLCSNSAHHRGSGPSSRSRNRSNAPCHGCFRRVDDVRIGPAAQEGRVQPSQQRRQSDGTTQWQPLSRYLGAAC